MSAGVTSRIDCETRPKMGINVRSARSIRGGLEPGYSAVRRNPHPVISVTGGGWPFDASHRDHGKRAAFAKTSY